MAGESIFLAAAAAFPVVAIGAAKLLRLSAPSVAKLEAYECGTRAASDSRGRYTVRFYIIATPFVIFDVETIFLYSWAVRYGSLLDVGYIWAYKKGALDWVQMTQSSPSTPQQNPAAVVQGFLSQAHRSLVGLILGSVSRRCSANGCWRVLAIE